MTFAFIFGVIDNPKWRFAGRSIDLPSNCDAPASVSSRHTYIHYEGASHPDGIGNRRWNYIGIISVAGVEMITVAKAVGGVG